MLRRARLFAAIFVASVFMLAGQVSANTIPPSPTAHFYGDANGDTIVSLVDQTVHSNAILLKAATYDTLQPPGSESDTCDVNSDNTCSLADKTILANVILLNTFSIADKPWVITVGLPASVDPSSSTAFQVSVSSRGGLNGRPGIPVVATIESGTGMISGRACTPVAGTRDQFANGQSCALSVTITDWAADATLGLTETGGTGFTFHAPASGDTRILFTVNADPKLDMPLVTTSVLIGATQPDSISLNCPVDANENEPTTCAVGYSGPSACTLGALTTCVGATLTGCATVNIPAQGEAAGPGVCAIELIKGPVSDTRMISILEVNAAPTWTTSPTSISVGNGEAYNQINGVASDTDLPNAGGSDPGNLVCSVFVSTCGFPVTYTGSGAGSASCSLDFTAPASGSSFCTVTLDASDGGGLYVRQTITIDWRLHDAWTWMGGRKKGIFFGEYGIKEMSTPSNLPGVRQMTASWIDSSANLWIFGGEGYSENNAGFLNDLWKWDGTNWTWVSGSKTSDQVGIYGTKGLTNPINMPGARRRVVTWKDIFGNFWLFGGEGYSASGGGIGNYLNDLWKWDGANWTWISGSDTTNQNGMYGIKGVPASTNMPGARMGSVSWIDASGNLWLFGGYGYASSGSGCLNDLWKWDGTNWTWVSGSNLANELGVYGFLGNPSTSNVPGSRAGAVAWTDTAGNFFIFAGSGYASDGGPYPLNDLWKWDGTNWTWIAGSDLINQFGSYGIKGSASSANMPGGRYGAAGVEDSNGVFWIFGGDGLSESGSGLLNDLWKWDGVNWTWMGGNKSENQIGVYGTKGITDPNNAPGSRTGALLWTDSYGNLGLFGGEGFATDPSVTQKNNDLWKWDGNDWVWLGGISNFLQNGIYGEKGIPDPMNEPGLRESSVSWVDNSGNFWLFGGYGAASIGPMGYLNDLWKWDGINWIWVAGSDSINQYGNYGAKGQSDPANLPRARKDAVSWTDLSGNLWLFGGATMTELGTCYLNDLWKWDGTNWTWVGGSDNLDQYGVYLFKGTPQSGNVVGARERSVSWVDLSGNLWLLGGYGYASGGSRNMLNDLWKWDGANWTWVEGSNAVGQKGNYGTKGVPSANNTPGARGDAVAWRDMSGNFWLSGGVGLDGDGGLGYLNDLWKWDGTDWIWISGSNSTYQTGVYGIKGTPAPNNVPGARFGAISWTDAYGNLWLFGGYGSAAIGPTRELSDLWKWDGTFWTWVSGSNSSGQNGQYGDKGIPAFTNVPGARSRSVSWSDAFGNLWLLGGLGYYENAGETTLNDLWRYTP